MPNRHGCHFVAGTARLPGLVATWEPVVALGNRVVGQLAVGEGYSLIQREMGRSDFPVMRASPLALVAAAGLLVWLAFAVVTPYIYRHQPGPRNASFGWYMLYQSLPLLILAAVFVLVFFALRLWKPWSRPQIPAIAAAVTTGLMFLGAMLVVFSRG